MYWEKSGRAEKVFFQFVCIHKLGLYRYRYRYRFYYSKKLNNIIYNGRGSKETET